MVWSRETPRDGLLVLNLGKVVKFFFFNALEQLFLWSSLRINLTRKVINWVNLVKIFLVKIDKNDSFLGPK